ncbi:response regulator [Larkinella insperata]|uniref:Response regulator n=1 Tax=Larkinella insperata TaxID=332158 RepID=A0ABW3QN00_9BACT|nr:response regulator [Larkinella insperata]
MKASCFECVFLVDDDEDDQFLLQQVFHQYSPECQIRLLSNGVELIEALETINSLPALVMLDLNMPYMSGFEALEAIRKDEKYQSLPIVILTTSDQQIDQQRAIQLGANDFITKPTLLADYSQVVLRLRKQWLVGRCVR